MSTTLAALSAAAPTAVGWAVHGWFYRRRLAMARRDPLTGLLTRDGFTKAAERRLADPRAAVLVLDLDGFKALNDTHGHAAGDAVLAVVGERLRQWQAPVLTAARLGGDEFAAALTGTGHAPAHRIAAGLHRLLTLPATTEFGLLRVGCSLGMAQAADYPGTGLPGLLRAADEAMYRAKQSRTGWSVADPALPGPGDHDGRRAGRR